jgi:hypothetical protein
MKNIYLVEKGFGLNRDILGLAQFW